MEFKYKGDEKIKEYNKLYYEKNKEKNKQANKLYVENNKEKINKNRKQYKLNNKEEINNKAKIYYQKNKEVISEKSKEYQKINREKIKKYIKGYVKNRRKIEPLFKLRMNIRNLIGNSIKNKGYTKKTKTFEILGCSYEEFKQHLERQFKKGMTWDNLGQWHLDHIYPVSIAKDEAELIKLNHYTNFQPMWAAENISKGNKIIPNTQIKLI